MSKAKSGGDTPLTSQERFGLSRYSAEVPRNEGKRAGGKPSERQVNFIQEINER
jgi:hypothetical protein